MISLSPHVCVSYYFKSQTNDGWKMRTASRLCTRMFSATVDVNLRFNCVRFYEYCFISCIDYCWKSLLSLQKYTPTFLLWVYETNEFPNVPFPSWNDCTVQLSINAKVLWMHYSKERLMKDNAFHELYFFSLENLQKYTNKQWEKQNVIWKKNCPVMWMIEM